MKRYVVALLTSFVFIASANSQTLSSAVSFEERVHNFGTILEEKGKVSHTFVFHNNGKTPVVISEIHSACGCIGKVLDQNPVKPGEKGKVTITFNPAYKSGFFSNEIIVYSNDNQEFNRIWVEGSVTPAEHPIEDDYPYNFGSGLHLRLKVIAFGYLKPGETREMELHYANSTNREMSLSFVSEGSARGLVFSNPGRIGAGARGIVNFSYTMPATGNDDVVVSLHPYVNNKKLKETLDLRILNENKRSQ